MTEAESTAVVERIEDTTVFDDLGDCQVVIEAAPKDLEPRCDVFGAPDEITDDALLATNIPTLSITSIAAATGAP